MRHVVLENTTVDVSRLSFGTGSLHHRPSRKARAALLGAAFDLGITHFDTSPYYGFGLAETDLGKFLRAVRGATVATKVGIYPAGGATSSAFRVWMRKAAGKLLPTMSRPLVDWSLEAARRSLDESLRRLRVARVDLLLLHEPVHGLIQTDEFRGWLQREQAEGRVGFWGLAGDAASMEQWVSRSDSLANVLQVKDSLAECEADSLRRFGRRPQLTYGYLSSVPPEGRRNARGVIAAALRRNTGGSVIVSARDRKHLAELVVAADAARDSAV